MMLAGAGFIVPFMFVYGPALLLVGSPLTIAIAIVSAMAGVTALAAAAIGFTKRPLAIWERALLGAAALALMLPGVLTDAFGFLVLALVFFRKVPASVGHGGG